MLNPYILNWAEVLYGREVWTQVKKNLEKKKIDEEELPCAYAATVTTTTYEILYECKDCGEKWTETKEETKFN